MPAAVLNAESAGEPGASRQTTGWFGKIPAAGDFIQRRLPNAFRNPWDEWLQDGIACGRAALDDRWDEVYLTFPVWRFVLPAGAAGPECWAGILLPSIDRVGRQFPLTIAAALQHDLEELSLTELESQLTAIEAAGLAALDGESSETFDAQIRQLPCSGIGSTQRAAPWLPAIQDPLGEGQWPLARPFERELADAAGRSMLSSLGTRTLWWLPGNENSSGTIRLHRWPLAAAVFLELIQQN